ncbi:MAG: alkyl/aryl-sulfatase, partial [Paracoccus sp. (in: a-proteobacteria)]
IRGEKGNAVYDTSSMDFVTGPAPDTVNPSLWRHAELMAETGLYEVAEGIYQVRNFDVTTMSVIRGDKGWIAVDPVISTEPAAAALKLLQDKVADLPVTAVIFTHSHIDHFGGVKGWITEEQVRSGEVQVIAPEGFFDHAVSEMLLAGNAMSRRAHYMHNAFIDRSPTGTMGSGLGSGISNGTITIIEPNVTIAANTMHDGGEAQKMTVDGVEIWFHATPGAEAPAELMAWFPKQKALLHSEIMNHTMHNLYTPRGTQARNGLLWSKYIQDVIVRYGDQAEISFGSHFWPVWGNAEINAFWKGQRDIYRYIHDETLRLANHGLSMNEIAEEVHLPESLSHSFSNRGYYGSLNTNVKGQYQFYYGWFSGNPSELNELPPEAEAAKFVEYAGGADAILEKARADYAAGEYRWVATALNKVVFADPENQPARDLLADTLSQMAWQSENGVWRNFFLSGAQELRVGTAGSKGPQSGSADIVRALDLESYLDYLGVRMNGPKAAEAGTLRLNLVLPDRGESAAITVENGALSYVLGTTDEAAQATLTIDRTVLDQVNLQQTTFADALAQGKASIEGDPQAFQQFLGLMDSFDLYFNIVTP